jgi:hypothetical protein
MTSTCLQCGELFSQLARHEKPRFRWEMVVKTAAQGCEVCSILRNALEQLAKSSPFDQTTGPENQRILHGDAEVTGYGTLIPSGCIKSGAYEFLFYYQQGMALQKSGFSGPLYQ